MSDALRRLVTQGLLSEEDRVELLAFFQEEGGLPDEATTAVLIPLAAKHLPNRVEAVHATWSCDFPLSQALVGARFLIGARVVHLVIDKAWQLCRMCLLNVHSGPTEHAVYAAEMLGEEVVQQSSDEAHAVHGWLDLGSRSPSRHGTHSERRW
jgi:hypothetical protein